MLHLSGARLSPDATRIADFIRGEEIARDLTVFAGLSRLPAAHRLDASGVESSIARYWQVSLPPPEPAEDAPARLRAALKAATEARVTAETGAMLSGGLDSSTLAGLAAETARGQGFAPLRTLSFVYGADKPYDESRYIDTANAAFGSEGHAITITSGPDLGTIAPLIEEQMDLFLAPGLQNSRRIYAEARGLGLSSLLNGHGGDEVISHGYARLVELAAHRAWGRLFVEARGAARTSGMPFWAVYLSHIAEFGGLRRRSFLRRVLARLSRMFSGKSLLSGNPRMTIEMIAPQLRAEIEAETRYAKRPSFTTPEEFRKAARLKHLEEIAQPISESAFEALHRSATAAGVLPLYPFYDLRVVELCLALPSETKLRNGQTRWVLREAMRGLLPESIRTRQDKAIFSAEMVGSVQRFYQSRGPEPFRPLAAYLDLEQVNRQHAALLAGTLSDHKDLFTLHVLWRLAVLLTWFDACARWQEQQADAGLI